jgi:hypothetical protein
MATSWKTGRFSGHDFPLQPDGTLRCPAGSQLRSHELRREADGSLRVVYAASIRSCRACSLREQCQWNGNSTAKPRQVSVLLHPLVIGSEAVRWRDWSRRQHRRGCMQLLRHQRVEVRVEHGLPAVPTLPPAPLSRAQRAHYRLTFQERLARNARVSTTGPVTVKLFGVPEGFAALLGLAAVEPCSHNCYVPFLPDKPASPRGIMLLPFPDFSLVPRLCGRHVASSTRRSPLRLSVVFAPSSLQ